MKNTLRQSQHSVKVGKGNNVNPTCNTALNNVMNPCNGRRVRRVTGCVNTVNTVSAFGSKLVEALRNNS